MKHEEPVKVCGKHDVEFCGERPCDICRRVREQEWVSTICIAYAEKYAEVKRLSDAIRRDEDVCSKVDAGEDCITRLFSAPRGPDGEFPRRAEFLGAMCPRCTARLGLLDERRIARADLGVEKRRVLALGKKLLSVRPIPAPPATEKGQEK